MASSEELVALTRIYGSKVYSVARRFAHQPADVEDLVQDIWTRILEILPNKNPRSSMGGWVHLVAVNVAREWSRKRYRWHDLAEKAGIHLWDAAGAPASDSLPVEDRVKARIWAEVYALPDTQRDVAILRIFEGLTTKQTAEVIDRSEGTVKASLHDALEVLRSRLSDLEPLWVQDDL